MLIFNEETHTYSLENTTLQSVSSVVESQFKKFNADIVSAQLAKTKSNDRGSRYYGMTRDDIIKMWNENGRQSREMGLQLHRNIEQFYKYGEQPSDTDPIEWKQFLQFNLDHPDWLCIGNEVQVHNNKIAGTIDAIFRTPEGVVLVDWKRCKSIDFSGYGNGNGVMKHVPDCNYSKYSLQLSLYRRLIGIDILHCYIIQLHPELDNYQKIKAQNYDIEVEQLIN